MAAGEIRHRDIRRRDDPPARARFHRYKTRMRGQLHRQLLVPHGAAPALRVDAGRTGFKLGGSDRDVDGVLNGLFSTDEQTLGRDNGDLDRP